MRPIAVGGMLVGAGYRSTGCGRTSSAGLSRAFAELGGKVPHEATVGRTERYSQLEVLLAMIGGVFCAHDPLYVYLNVATQAGFVAAVVMLIAGFFYLPRSRAPCRLIGRPTSDLRSDPVHADHRGALDGSRSESRAGGVLAVWAWRGGLRSGGGGGELLQDFKVRWILGGTPRTIQIVEIVAVALLEPRVVLPAPRPAPGNINAGGIGFGDPALPAPQAGLMAATGQGIVGRRDGLATSCRGNPDGRRDDPAARCAARCSSPWACTCRLGTTFAIFVGGMIRGVVDRLRAKRGVNAAQNARVENVGILVASGLIAGEALVGLVTATFNFFEWPIPEIFPQPSYVVGLGVMALLAWVLVRVPLANAGRPEEPAPPTAIV